MTDGTPTSSRQLPLPDYDHLPTGSLQYRIRSLTLEELEQVLDYDRQHADRASVRTLIEARLQDLRDGAAMSTGDATAARPEAAPPPSGGDTVTPETSGPPMNPPAHGVPSNPAQPRRPDAGCHTAFRTDAEQHVTMPPALITGAFSGIGFELLAKLFAGDGYDLIVVADDAPMPTSPLPGQAQTPVISGSSNRLRLAPPVAGAVADGGERSCAEQADGARRADVLALSVVKDSTVLSSVAPGPQSTLLRHA
jgi:hypothetical protein